MLALLSASYKEYKLGVCQLKVSTSYRIVEVKKIEQCFRYKNKGTWLKKKKQRKASGSKYVQIFDCLFIVYICIVVEDPIIKRGDLGSH